MPSSGANTEFFHDSQGSQRAELARAADVPNSIPDPILQHLLDSDGISLLSGINPEEPPPLDTPPTAKRRKSQGRKPSTKRRKGEGDVADDNEPKTPPASKKVVPLTLKDVSEAIRKVAPGIIDLTSEGPHEDQDIEKNISEMDEKVKTNLLLLFFKFWKNMQAEAIKSVVKKKKATGENPFILYEAACSDMDDDEEDAEEGHSSGSDGFINNEEIQEPYLADHRLVVERQRADAAAATATPVATAATAATGAAAATAATAASAQPNSEGWTSSSEDESNKRDRSGRRRLRRLSRVGKTPEDERIDPGDERRTTAPVPAQQGRGKRFPHDRPNLRLTLKVPPKPHPGKQPFQPYPGKQLTFQPHQGKQMIPPGPQPPNASDTDSDEDPEFDEGAPGRSKDERPPQEDDEEEEEEEKEENVEEEKEENMEEQKDDITEEEKENEGKEKEKEKDEQMEEMGEKKEEEKEDEKEEEMKEEEHQEEEAGTSSPPKPYQEGISFDSQGGNSEAEDNEEEEKEEDPKSNEGNDDQLSGGNNDVPRNPRNPGSFEPTPVLFRVSDENQRTEERSPTGSPTGSPTRRSTRSPTRRSTRTPPRLQLRRKSKKN